MRCSGAFGYQGFLPAFQMGLWFSVVFPAVLDSSPVMLFLKIFLMWTICKFFIEFVTILLLFHVVFFFGPGSCGSLAPQPSIEPIPSTLECKILTTGPPGQS